jgi:hypothetical protein
MPKPGVGVNLIYFSIVQFSIKCAIVRQKTVQCFFKPERLLFFYFLKKNPPDKKLLWLLQTG